MITNRNLTTARQGFSELYTETFAQCRPSIIKRNKGEEILLIRADLQKMMLSAYTIKVKILNENDGSVTVTTEPLELWSNACDENTAMDELIKDLKMYADDYLSRAHYFLQSPNRKEHFPYVLRIAMCHSDEEIKEALEVTYASEI